MNKILAVITTLLVAATAWANPIDDACPQFALRGAPVSQLQPGTTQYLCKQNYAIHYRYDTKTAEYVLEHITLQHITGANKRKDDFRPDPSIPKQYQSTLADYAGFPFDRGHLAPGADNTHTAEAMSESFFLSNMVPQVPNHNRGIWKQLETAVRNWVLEGKDIYVVSGTIYGQGYQTIGAGKVGIPTHMWKVIVDRKSAKAIAFLFPNAPLPVADLPKYATNVATIEQYTGLNFHPQLPEQLKHIETDPVDLSLWSSLR